MKATQMPRQENTLLNPILYMAFELGKNNWGLAFSNGKRFRYKSVPARLMSAVDGEIKLALDSFNLPKETVVVSCYEAGRDGFWLHRTLLEKGIQNIVVDSASIEVNRRARRNKCDRLDANSLVRMLFRYLNGETRVWSVLHIPTPEVEDEKRSHRERERLKKEQGAHTNRIKSLLYNQGIVIDSIRTSSEWLQKLITRDGGPLRRGLLRELTRELERLHIVREQLKKIDKEKAKLLKEGQSITVQKILKLAKLRGIGPISSWNLVFEFLWRHFNNVKQVGSAAGLAPSFYQSGKMDHDLGISKAGNRRVRSLMVELSWLWLRYQPKSYLSQWYLERFGTGSKRMRKVGIVALARKLLVALWKYLERDTLPQGALLKT